MVGYQLGRRPSLIAFSVAVLLIAALAMGSRASAATTQPAAADGHATRLGVAPRSGSLPLILPLKVDGGALARFASAVSTPGSPLYGDYLSIPALARRFGASVDERSRVVSFLRSHGATSVHVDATGTLAEANMSVASAEHVFGTPLAQYRSDDRTRFVAPTGSTPTLPAGLRGLVDGVVGLDGQPVVSGGALSTRDLSASLRRELTSDAASGPTARAAQSTASVFPRTGTPAGCPGGMVAGGQNPGFTPNQYLTAYGFDPLHQAGLGGQGERVALIEIDGFNMSDVKTFDACFGIPAPHVSAWGVGVAKALPAGVEATLDMEILTAAAPSLKAVDVYETKPTAQQTLAAFAAPLQKASRRPQVISASLGLCEPDALGASGVAGIEASERLLQLAAADGVTVFASSGDTGSADCQGNDGTPIDGLAVNYPASSWWVTGVGGTNLSLNAQNGIVAQPVWNDTNVFVAGGGGGYSRLFKRPPYQTGVIAADKRGVPDVSMLADLLPGYAVYCSATGSASSQGDQCVSSKNPNPWQSVGGTSAGTPLLAGGAALIDQLLRSNHRENMGLLNPLLYKLGPSAVATSVFSDVTQGDNDIGPFILGGNGQPLGCCTAVTGFDPASGWGSVSIAGLGQQALAYEPQLVSVKLSIPAHQHPVASGAVRGKLTCSAACRVGLVVTIKIGKHSYAGQSNEAVRHTPGAVTLTVKFTARAKQKFRTALAHHQRVTVSVSGAQIDKLGSIEHDTPTKSFVAKS